MNGEVSASVSPQRLIVELCQLFYKLGWVSGTGGGISIREGGKVYIAPSGVQKERLSESDVFVLDYETGGVLDKPSDEGLRISACEPLFMKAFRIRGAGAVLHSHSINAVLATLISGDTFEVTHLEMMKGIAGVGYHDTHVVPVIENTAHECDLADAMADAIRNFPSSNAVLVRRHGVYVWGDDWVQAKTQAECYDYLFEAAVKMHRLGLNPAEKPENKA